MATIYVDSNATGSNDGTSWANAYTSIASTASAAAGSEIWVASNHSQTGALSVSYTNATIAAPIKILSVSSVDDSLTAGASLISTGVDDISITGLGLFFHGITFDSGDDISIGSGDSSTAFESCTFNSTDALNLGGVGGFLQLIGCTIDRQDVGAFSIQVGGDGAVVKIKNCSFAESGSPTNALLNVITNGSLITIEDSDLTNVSSDFFNSPSGKSGFVLIRRCKLPSSYTLHSSSITQKSFIILLENCDDGVIAVAPLGITKCESFTGSCSTVLTQYRSGGADDGSNVNPYSWRMQANSNAAEIYNPLESPSIARWVGVGSQTVTVYVASGETLNDDDFWIEVSSPDEGGSATARGTFSTTRVAPLATPAALTTDAVSTWNGTGVGTKQKVSVSINPAVAGPVTVRCFLAKPSTTVYVDPKIEVA